MVPARGRDPRRPDHADRRLCVPGPGGGAARSPTSATRFDPASQGRGYATEAVGELVRYLFEDRGKHKVTADCDTRNEGSWRLLERLGFTREAEFKAAYREGDGWADAYVYGLLADEWSERSTVNANPSNRTGSTT